MKHKIIKVDAQNIVKPKWRYPLECPYFNVIGVNLEHANYCELKTGLWHSCDCHLTLAQPIILAVRIGKKRVLVKGSYYNDMGEFTPSNQVQREKLIKILSRKLELEWARFHRTGIL